MRQLLVRAGAAGDIEEAYGRYQRQRAGLGEEFLVAVDAILCDIVTHPTTYPVIHREAKRALLRRFPYAIFYRVRSEPIIVIACMHGRRDPIHWKGRT